MTVAIVIGSGGLVGSKATMLFVDLGFEVVGIDNDMRRHFFGPPGSTCWQNRLLSKGLGEKFIHKAIDVREKDAIESVFRRYSKDISLVVHCAAHPDKALQPFSVRRRPYLGRR